MLAAFATFATFAASAAFFGPPPVGKYTCARTAPFHPAVHNLGNVGFTGVLHAHSAWFATRVIDRVAYDGRHMRRELAEALASRRRGRRLVEVGCGAGTLTSELVRTGAFDVVALDTSGPMLDVASRMAPGAAYLERNGADVGEFHAADVAIACMVFHELPADAQREVALSMAQSVRSSERGGEVWIVDIDPSYEPSPTMLSGEPYVLGYLAGIDAVLEGVRSDLGATLETFEVIAGHVRAWVLRLRVAGSDPVASG